MANGIKMILPKIGVIGIGQGGSNLALAIADVFKTKAIGLINLSQSDLNVAISKSTSPATIKSYNLGNGVEDGAGKNRELSLNKYIQNQDDIKKFIWDEILKNKELLENRVKIDILYITFATAGGTGSGIGPILTAYLNSSEFRNIDPVRYPTIVTGIAICPDSSEGIKNQQNTLEALQYISVYSEQRLGRYMLVNNDLALTASEIASKNLIVNESVANFLHRYIYKLNTSRLGNLDLADRLTALSYPGVHSFCTYGDNSESINSPFILPEGARVNGMYGEVPEHTKIETLEEIVTALGLQIDDKTIGYYEPDNETNSIIHFSGYSNLKRATERYQNIVSEIKSKSQRAERNDQILGTGLTKIGDNKKWINSSSSVVNESGVEDLLNLVDTKTNTNDILTTESPTIGKNGKV